MQNKLLQIKIFFEYVLWQYFIVAVFCAITYTGVNFFSFDKIAQYLLVLLLGLFSFNSLNNIIDYDLDKINKPKRPLPSGRMSFLQAYLITGALFLSCFLIAYSISFNTLLMSLLYLIFCVIYSNHKFGLRRFFLGNFLAGGVLHALIPFAILYSIFGRVNFYFLLLFFVLFGLVTLTKDFEDLKGDKKFGFNTEIYKFGKKSIFFIILSSFALSSFIMVFLAFSNFIDRRFLLPSLLSFFPVVLFGSYYYKVKSSKHIVTQDRLVTFSMLFISLVQVCYLTVLIF